MRENTIFYPTAMGGGGGGLKYIRSGRAERAKPVKRKAPARGQGADEA